MIILRQSWKKAVPDIFLFLQILTSAPLLHLCVIPTPFVITPKVLITVPAKLELLAMDKLVNVRMFGL